MRVYIAARYSRKYDMKLVRLELERNGLLCTSSWLNEPHAPDTEMQSLTEEMNREYATTDLHDIDRADHVLFFSESVLTPRGGRHVEFGYALGVGKIIHVIGPRENIFHYLEHVNIHDSVSDYIEYVKQSIELVEEVV